MTRTRYILHTHDADLCNHRESYRGGDGTQKAGADDRRRVHRRCVQKRRGPAEFIDQRVWDDQRVWEKGHS
jgi:hypothetical protein